MIDEELPAYSLIYRKVYDVSEMSSLLMPKDGGTIFPDVYITNSSGTIGFSYDSSRTRTKGLSQIEGDTIMLIAPGNNVGNYLKLLLDEKNRAYEMNEGFSVSDPDSLTIVTREGAFVLTHDGQGLILNRAEPEPRREYQQRYYMENYRRRLRSSGVIPRRIS